MKKKRCTVKLKIRVKVQIGADRSSVCILSKWQSSSEVWTDKCARKKQSTWGLLLQATMHLKKQMASVCLCREEEGKWQESCTCFEGGAVQFFLPRVEEFSSLLCLNTRPSETWTLVNFGPGRSVCSGRRRKVNARAFSFRPFFILKKKLREPHYNNTQSWMKRPAPEDKVKGRGI